MGKCKRLNIVSLSSNGRDEVQPQGGESNNEGQIRRYGEWFYIQFPDEQLSDIMDLVNQFTNREDPNATTTPDVSPNGHRNSSTSSHHPHGNESGREKSTS